MKNIIYILLSTVLLIACSNDKELVQDNFYASEDSPLTFTMQAPSIIEGEEMNFNKEGLKDILVYHCKGKTEVIMMVRTTITCLIREMETNGFQPTKN